VRFTPSKFGQRSPPTYYRGCWHVVSRGFFCGYRLRSSPLKGVYTPKGFVLHAASLGQACAHCPKFPTAASRRSGARVSVPLGPIILSDRLPVVGLVSRYLTNNLIGRGPIPKRQAPLDASAEAKASTSGISPSFPGLSQSSGQVTHVLLRRSPLSAPRRTPTARLACLRHAASVRPEPGSNSPSENGSSCRSRLVFRIDLGSQSVLTCPVFKVYSALAAVAPSARADAPCGISSASLIIPHPRRVCQGHSRLRTQFLGSQGVTSRPKDPCSEAGYILPCPRQRCQGFKPDSGQIRPKFRGNSERRCLRRLAQKSTNHTAR
jgi:hypothetical protein